MDIKTAAQMFAALAQETRLRALRLLVRAGPAGLAAGSLSAELGTPHNTMSFHLSHLSQAGLIVSRREGRSVIYSAHFDSIRNLLGFLIEDCCSADVARVTPDAQRGCSVIELAGYPIDCP